MACPRSAWSALAVVVALSPASVAARPLAWTVDGRRHVVEMDDPWTERGGEYGGVLSVVGPIVSRVSIYDYESEVGGWTERELRVELLDGYDFDLERYLDGLGRSGEALAARVRLATGAEALPERVAIDRRPWREIFGELTAAGQFHSGPAHSEDGRLPFVIESWDPAVGVTVSVQVLPCHGTRSVCDITHVVLVIPAPAEWVPWLAEARAGNGMLGEDRARWAAELRPSEMERMRSELERRPTPGARLRYLRTHPVPRRSAYALLRELEGGLPVSDGLRAEIGLELLRILEGFGGDTHGAFLSVASQYFQSMRIPTPVSPRLARRLVRAVAAYYTSRGARSGPDQQRFVACAAEPDPLPCAAPFFGSWSAPESSGGATEDLPVGPVPAEQPFSQRL